MQIEYKIAEPVSKLIAPSDPMSQFVALLNHYGKEGWQYCMHLPVSSAQGQGVAIIVMREKCQQLR